MASERKFVVENIKRVLLKEFIRKQTERAGFGGLDIQRTPMGTRLILTAERPGMIIGRKGATIKEITEKIQNKFNLENPRIEVHEDTEPALNPYIMAQKLASALERGWHFRRAGHSTVRRIMESGARGCQVIISGKLTGERHRTEKFRKGHIKYCGEPAKIWMKEGFAVAKKKSGVIGVKVQIMDKNAKLPDEVVIISLEDKLKAESQDVPVEAETEAKELLEEEAKDKESPAAKPTKEVPSIKDPAEIEDTAKDIKKISKRKEKRRERAQKREDIKVEPEPKPEPPKKEEPVPEPVKKVEPRPEPPKKEEPVPVPEKKVEPRPEPPKKEESVPVPEKKVEPKPEPPKEEEPAAPEPEEKVDKKEKKKDDLDDLLSKLEKDLEG